MTSEEVETLKTQASEFIGMFNELSEEEKQATISSFADTNIDLDIEKEVLLQYGFMSKIDSRFQDAYIKLLNIYNEQNS
ncbi:hypothetical protein [Staphylococcus sp. LKG3-3]|uniref:hypothetical protein n=1 Tax=Staphylococcus sp. LKG3-3 TaxID=3399685 RepID=UPI003D5CDFE5